jgi:transposase
MVICLSTKRWEVVVIGEKKKEEKLFYYLRPEDLIPEDHILRLIDHYVDFSFIRPKLEHLYSHTGRPSVDPDVMMRMLLVGYLFGITSERRLCDEVGMHLGYRWFVGLALDEKVPDHSTFSKNRHGRFKESGVYQQIFDQIVLQCVEKGLVSGKHLTVDSTLVKANASFKNLEPIVVSLRPEQYIEKVEKENPVIEEQDSQDGPWEPQGDYPQSGGKVSNKTHRSTVDPDSRIVRKSNFSETYLGHGVSYVMDNKTRVVVGADQNLPNRNADAETAVRLVGRLKWAYKLSPRTLGADKGYATGLFVHWLLEQGVLPHVPMMDARSRNEKGIYPIQQFDYDAKKDQFLCPQGKTLRYWGIHKPSKQHVYRASPKDCRQCSLKEQCTRATYRSLSYHIYESSIDVARKLANTRGYRISQRMRKKVEELFGEAKECMGLRRAKFRGALYVKEQVLLTASAQNIKRMARLLWRKRAKVHSCTLPAAFNGIVLETIHIIRRICSVQWLEPICYPYKATFSTACKDLTPVTLKSADSLLA